MSALEPTRKESQELLRLQDALPRATTREEALEIAMAAAELSMRAMKLAKDPATKRQASAETESLLQNAERIKNQEDWKVASESSPTIVPFPSPRKIRLLREPVSTRVLKTSEKILLLKASSINGYKFVPWTGEPTDDSFSLAKGQQPFQDGPLLPLSPSQLEELDAWKRPADALPPPRLTRDGPKSGPTMSSTSKVDLVQDAATDCSVVASLCAITARTERGLGNILKGVIYPWDQDHDQPQMSCNGKYIVRLNLNGAYRTVQVDDRLPVTRSDRILHVVDRNTPSLLWPALAEKAYLKVRGGYDFPGSNSGTDLWILTGWIPEQIFLQSDDTSMDDLWTRIRRAHGFGDVLVTMGTGKMSRQVETATGLAGEHDYAVLDMQERNGRNFMLVKNPWSEGTSWLGSVSEQVDELIETDGDNPGHDMRQANHQLSPGTFWMDLHSISQSFESIYLNWNSGLFSYRQDIHFSWNTSRASGGSLTDHPQLSITVSQGGILWLLLCYHFQDAGAAIYKEEVENGENKGEVPGFIGLCLYDAQGHRVYLQGAAVEQSPLVDSPQILLRVDNLAAGQSYTAVPVHHELAAMDHNFTLCAFANSSIQLDHAVDRHQHQITVSASWTEETAGGNAEAVTYSRNPQFSITVPSTTPITMLIESATPDVPVHVKMVHGRGQRVQAIRSRDIVFDSKDYKHGCALAQHDSLAAGTYTIICSTFEAGQIAGLSLQIYSDAPVQLKQLPREGAGRIRQTLSQALFKPKQEKLAAPLVPNRLTKTGFLVKHLAPDEARSRGSSSQSQTSQRTAPRRSLIQVTVEMGIGPHRRILIASGNGEYSDSPSGMRTAEIDLSPAIAVQAPLWLVIERAFTPGGVREEVFCVDMFTDQPDGVRVGVWRAWDE